MNAQEYAKYQQSVESNLKYLNFVSTGACSACEQCGNPDTDHALELASEPQFCWSTCDSCGSTLGGDRHPAHGRDKDNALVHFEVCTDCLYFLNYGRLDDQSMLEIEETTHD